MGVFIAPVSKNTLMNFVHRAKPTLYFDMLLSSKEALFEGLATNKPPQALSG
jgi:hypothetical protein